MGASAVKSRADLTRWPGGRWPPGLGAVPGVVVFLVAAGLCRRAVRGQAGAPAAV